LSSFVVAGFADDVTIIIGTFERWFKYCDESKLNSPLQTTRKTQGGVKQRTRPARVSSGFMRANAGNSQIRISLQCRSCKLSFYLETPATHREGAMKLVRTTAIVAASAFALALMAIGPARAADPLGTWLTGDKKGKVKIVNCGSAICGNLIWLAEPTDPDTGQPKTDKHNSNASLAGRPLLGIPIVLNMAPGGPDQWEGKVYNAEDGGTYTGSFTMTSANSAVLKGCVAGGLICKGQTWTRSN
jgi:uncharacterized protein (DUF2147 family)